MVKRLLVRFSLEVVVFTRVALVFVGRLYAASFHRVHLPWEIQYGFCLNQLHIFQISVQDLPSVPETVPSVDEKLDLPDVPTKPPISAVAAADDDNDVVADASSKRKGISLSPSHAHDTHVHACSPTKHNAKLLLDDWQILFGNTVLEEPLLAWMGKTVNVLVLSNPFKLFGNVNGVVSSWTAWTPTILSSLVWTL